MGYYDQSWNRDELYQEVWSTPLKTLAKKYGISDVGLAKACRKLLIPLPGRGYRAKKEADQAVRQAPLPPLKEKIFLRKPTPRPDPPKLDDIATQPEVAQIEQLERAVGEAPLKPGSLSHPLIVQARSVLRGARHDDRKILHTQDPCLDIRVSKDSLDRALRIMAGLINGIEDAGFTVSVEAGHRGKTVARIYGQVKRFGLVGEG